MLLENAKYWKNQGVMKMLINKNRNPKYSLYYIGAIVLENLVDKKEITIECLFDIIKEKIDENLHIDFLYYTLDWLFLISIIDIDENRVILC